jgi:hypothetical protein
VAETVDDTHPLALDGRRDWGATIKFWGKVIVVVAPAVASAMVAIWTAAGDARARAQAARVEVKADVQLTKNKAESGYAEFMALERRVAGLEQLARQPAADPHRRLRGAIARRPLAPVPPPVPPPPANLDLAYKKVYGGHVQPPPAPPAPPPRGDAAP